MDLIAQPVSLSDYSMKSETPKLSIVIPAWNEAMLLPRTLEALSGALRNTAVEAECVVVDNASTDATASIARGYGARVVHEPERRIARARNAGAAAACGDWLLFLDADTLIGTEHLEALCEALAADAAGGGAPVSLDRELRGPTAWGLTLWNWLSRRFGLAAGCFLFVRRELHAEFGGFDERVFAGEELGYSLRTRSIARRRGLRFRILDVKPVTSSGRKLDWFPLWKHLLVMLLFVLFPFAGRFRRLSWFWYRRPPGQS